jgi:hypothetical protein
MLSPTGKGLRRADKWGRGVYGASRDHGKKKHKGADYECEPGQDIIAPVGGVIVRESRPYPHPDWFSRYSGLIIENKYMEIRMFYLEPVRSLIGKTVNAGDLVGIAQDISIRYPDMMPHIHLEIMSADPELFINFL